MVILLSFPSRTSVLRGRVASKVALDRTGELDNNSPTGITRLLLIVAFYYRISHLRTRFSIACQALQRIHKACPRPSTFRSAGTLRSPQAPSGASFRGTSPSSCVRWTSGRHVLSSINLVQGRRYNRSDAGTHKADAVGNGIAFPVGG